MTTKNEVEVLKREGEVKILIIRSRIAVWNELIAFFMSKFAGIVAITFGLIGIFNPSLVHSLKYVSTQPEVILGSGFTLLTGKSMLKLVVKGAKLLEENK